MTGKTLSSPADSVKIIAKMFQTSSVCNLSIREDRAFGQSEFLSLGKINLFPLNYELEGCTRAIQNGAFEWRTPKVEETTNEIKTCLGIADTEQKSTKNKTDDKVRRIIGLFGAIPVRLGLSHPIFDPYALNAMPFRRPVTVISDTSGVLMGGLNFVSKYLFPAARIKVPAIVQMEIVNFADRFLKNRRSSNFKSVDLLMDHMNSQAGQRALLLLELHSDIELERTFLFGDPLRVAFQSEKDQELRELNINVPIPSYVDRLILEAARQHQSQVASGHPVMLLTSDQGLARMTMAEGMHPLYFRAAAAKIFFNKLFTGTNFHPFTGKLCTTSIPEVLWELATIFGSARLSTTDGTSSLVVHAIGDDLAWVPYHSHDDLLWVETCEVATTKLKQVDEPATTSTSNNVAKTPSIKNNGILSRPTVQRPQSREIRTIKPNLPLYKFSLNRLITLIDKLETEQILPINKVMETIGIRTASGIKDYRRFLESGSAIVTDSQSWSATPILTPIAIALRNCDINELRKVLLVFPSYEMLERVLSKHDVGSGFDVKPFGRARVTFLALAETTELGATIHGSGFYVTPNDPENNKFAEISVSAYDRLEQGKEWVATGRWFEELIMVDGIHPIVARRRLQAVNELGLVRRITEGSTTEIGYDRHILKVLSLKDGTPFVKTEYLYRGDFLIPGKSSSSLKIEKIEK